MTAAPLHLCPLLPLAPLPRQTENLPGIGGRLRVALADFEVEELPAYLPSGQGDHLYLWVEKRDLSGPMLRRRLADRLGIDPSDVGMAGLKDRRAVTRQWVSVPARLPRSPEGLRDEHLQVLRIERHSNKLRTGHLHGNQFHIVVRDVAAPEALDAKVATLAAAGCPNFYGEQRMGHGGATLAAGWALAQGLDGRVRVQTPDGVVHQIYLRDKQLRRLAASALQAEVFNRVVARRLAEGTLRRVLPGDHCRKVDTGGSFVTDDAGREQARVDAGLVEITGPMWGPKMPRPSGAAAALEDEVLAAAGLHMDCFRTLGSLAEGTRRPLVVRPRALTATWDGETARLSFVLPAGSFATVLLHEVLGPHASVDADGLDAADPETADGAAPLDRDGALPCA